VKNVFEATLRNRSQPKLGALAVTFPIPEERYDWENFKKERIYAIHTQEFREAQYDNGNSQEDKSPLFKKFLSAISRWDNYAASTSTGWIEDITDERLAARLKELSQEDLELLTQFIIQGFTQSDLEQMGYGKQYKISRRISRLKNFLKK
jgi:hypothetical protein